MESLQQILSVVAVLGLLGGTLWWLRRRGLATIGALPGRRTGALQRVERLPLTPTHSLHLVKVGEREVLIACSPAGCQVIDAKGDGR